MSRAPDVTAEAAVVCAPRAPERLDPNPEKDETADHRQEPGEVVTGRSAAERVVHGLGAAQDTEEAKEERKRRPDPSSSAAVDDRSADEERKRYETAEEVVCSRGAQLRLEEVVVDDMECDQADGHKEDHQLGAVDHPS